MPRIAFFNKSTALVFTATGISLHKASIRKVYLESSFLVCLLLFVHVLLCFNSGFLCFLLFIILNIFRVAVACLFVGEDCILARKNKPKKMLIILGNSMDALRVKQKRPTFLGFRNYMLVESFEEVRQLSTCNSLPPMVNLFQIRKKYERSWKISGPKVFTSFLTTPQELVRPSEWWAKDITKQD